MRSCFFYILTVSAFWLEHLTPTFLWLLLRRSFYHSLNTLIMMCPVVSIMFTVLGACRASEIYMFIGFMKFKNFLVIISPKSLTIPTIHTLGLLKLPHSSSMLCPFFFLFFLSYFLCVILEFCYHYLTFTNLFSHSI